MTYKKWFITRCKRTNNNALPSQLKVALCGQAIPEVERSYGSLFIYKISTRFVWSQTRSFTNENIDQDLKMSGFFVHFASVMCMLVILTGPISAWHEWVSPTFPSDPDDAFYQGKTSSNKRLWDCIRRLPLTPWTMVSSADFHLLSIFKIIIFVRRIRRFTT